MSDKVKIILGVVGGILGAIALFSLIVVIGCSINGLTFGEQVCQWFGGNAGTIVDTAGEVAETITENALA